MAVSKFKTFSAGEVLTASDVNSSFDQVFNNGEDLGWPATKTKDLDGNVLILDGDGDTSITADSDDRIDIAVGGSDQVRIGHDSTNSSAFTAFLPAAVTAQANTNYAHVNIAPAGAVTVPAGTTAVVASAEFNEPNITATGTVTAAATVYIAAAPTEGSANYALWVDAGDVQLDGNLTVSGQSRSNKGSDISSADPLVLGTDGNYFDVTGTTGFSDITVAAGTWFILQFDAALVMTHGATLDLPGEANITTAAGDRAICFAEAANTVQVVAYVKADGSAVAGSVIGKQSIWVPAGAMRATVSNGAAAVADTETTAGRPDITGFAFDASADEHVQLSVAFPNSHDNGTFTAQYFWESTAADTDGVTWAAQAVSFADNESIDQAYGSAVTVDDANQGAAEELLVSAESGAITSTGIAANHLTYFRIFRDVSAANDTATEDATLIGVLIHYTVDAGTDA